MAAVEVTQQEWLDDVEDGSHYAVGVPLVQLVV